MKIFPSLPFLATLATLATFPSAQVGSVLRAQHINEASGGFGGSLQPDDLFGFSQVGLGDIDGDGVPDVAVSAPEDDDGGSDRGAIWILFLRADGTVRTQSKISQTQGGFTGVLTDDGYLGLRVANVGDLDGDGRAELAAFSGTPYRLWVLFLDANGRVRNTREDLFSDPVFNPPTQERFFGGFLSSGGLTGIGDVDGDGIGDLALGAPNDPSSTGPETGAVWILLLNADGSPKRAQKLTNGFGGLISPLLPGDNFGASLVLLGDLDGDGRRELGVSSAGSPLSYFKILSLDALGRVTAERSFGYDDYALIQPRGVSYGTSHIGWLGDLDGDGLDEVAMGFPNRNFPGGPQDEGGLAIGFQRADGSISKRVVIGHQLGGFGNLNGYTEFGQNPTLLGDLDGDGNPELAVGAPGDRAAGERTGGLWILSLSRSAVRNGSGINPLILTQASEPVFGATWSATLDCSGHAPGLAFVFGFTEPRSGIFSSAGETLVGGTRLFLLQAVHNSGPTVLQGTMPPFSLSLIDLPLFIQGACTGAPGVQLSNALGVVLER